MATSRPTLALHPDESGGDIPAPPGEEPLYYGVGWQVLLWLAVAVLALLMFG